LWQYEIQADIHSIERLTGANNNKSSHVPTVAISPNGSRRVDAGTGHRIGAVGIATWKQNWFTKNRWLLKRSIFYRVELFTFLFLWSLWILVTGLWGDYSQPCDAPHTPNGTKFFLSLTNGLIATWVLLPLVILAIGGWKLRRHKIDDAFGLKQVNPSPMLATTHRSTNRVDVMV
jgi:hypothetical protein